MSDKEKVIAYEVHIEDMLHALQDRLNELNQSEDLDDFEKGRQLAYTEMMEIIKTRHKIILEVLEED